MRRRLDVACVETQRIDAVRGSEAARALEQARLADPAGAVHEEHRDRRRLDGQRLVDQCQLGFATDEILRGPRPEAVDQTFHGAEIIGLLALRFMGRTGSAYFFTKAAISETSASW